MNISPTSTLGSNACHPLLTIGSLVGLPPQKSNFSQPFSFPSLLLILQTMATTASDNDLIIRDFDAATDTPETGAAFKIHEIVAVCLQYLNQRYASHAIHAENNHIAYYDEGDKFIYFMFKCDSYNNGWSENTELSSRVAVECDLIKIDQPRFDLGEMVRLHDGEEPRALMKEVCVVGNRWLGRDSFRV
jgi:hypothetical protein